MSTHEGRNEVDAMSGNQGPIEYPDEAGYPDGTGFLDEGTAGEDAAPSGEATDEADDLATFAEGDEADGEEDEEPDV